MSNYSHIQTAFIGNYSNPNLLRFVKNQSGYFRNKCTWTIAKQRNDVQRLVLLVFLIGTRLKNHPTLWRCMCPGGNSVIRSQRKLGYMPHRVFLGVPNLRLRLSDPAFCVLFRGSGGQRGSL